MLNKKEITAILISVFLMALILSFFENQFSLDRFAAGLLISLIIVFTAVFSKKITAKKIDTSIEINFWNFQRYWITRRAYFKKPVPAGLILPLLLAFLSEWKIKFLAFLSFESKALPSKASKKYGSYNKRYSNINEWDDALIGFYSMLGVLALGIISSIFSPSFFQELAKYSLYFAISNLLPISTLDGTRIFFGSRPLYVFSWVILVLAGLVIFI